jgi:hypothetical protein
LLLAPYALCKIERDSALLDHGFDEKKDVIVADPRKLLDRVVGLETEAIGLLTVHDPVGYIFCSVAASCKSIFRLINWKPAPSHTQLYHLAN